MLLLLYLTISLRHLAVVPKVYEDEPWQASTGWKLATQGVFGSDMFAGFYGMDRRYYGYMPIHPLLLAVVFRVAGVGLFQARFEVVLLGLLVLVLIYTLAYRLFDARVGLLAVLLLLSVRSTTLTPSQDSGILFLDIARIARYDMAVPVFGLAALHTYLSARVSAGRLRYIVSGGLAGLAGLAHLYGLFWLPVLALLALWDGRARLFRGTLSRIGWLVFGCALPWLPYAAYVLGDLESWRGQTRGYADRFDLLNPHWYLENVQRESLRYAPGLPTAGWERLLRVGYWSGLVALPLSLGALIFRSLRGDRAARALAVPALLQPLMFASLIHPKMINYLIAFFPLWALVVAWGGVTLWDWLGSGGVRGQGSGVKGQGLPTPYTLYPIPYTLGRVALALLLAAVLTEGAGRVIALERAAATTTPYDDYIGRVRQLIPPGSRVLGLHTYWLGLESFNYRSFAVPVFWANPTDQSAPVPFDVGLERIAPDVVLIDPRMREFFDDQAHGGVEVRTRLAAWMQRHQAKLIGRIDDQTYGLMEVYRVGQEPGVRGQGSGIRGHEPRTENQGRSGVRGQGSGVRVEGQVDSDEPSSLITRYFESEFTAKRK